MAILQTNVNTVGQLLCCMTLTSRGGDLFLPQHLFPRAIRAAPYLTTEFHGETAGRCGVSMGRDVHWPT